ncbi:MAG: hypothetical protein AAF329_09980 [Cyanobacteria bacterium P01_A01_bin.17]
MFDLPQQLQPEAVIYNTGIWVQTLAIAQEGNATVLGVSGGEALAVLRGVEAASLSEGRFVGVADGFEAEGAMALS